MKFCNNCGTQLDDEVKFCSKCGSAQQNIQEDAAASSDTVSKSQPKAEKKQVDVKGFFNKNFWILYIVFGAISFLLVELGGIYTNVSAGFTIFLGVMAVITAICFLIIAVMRRVLPAVDGESRMRDNICLAVGIIVFMFVMLGAIGLFDIAHNILLLQKAAGR